jgi:hypothetical protein
MTSRRPAVLVIIVCILWLGTTFGTYLNSIVVRYAAISIAILLVMVNWSLLYRDRFESSKPISIEAVFAGQRIWILVLLCVLLPVLAYLLSIHGFYCTGDICGF